MVLLKNIKTRKIFLLFICISFFLTFFFENKNKNDHVYYKEFKLDSDKIFGYGIKDNNNLSYTYLEKGDLLFVMDYYGFYDLQKIYSSIIESSIEKSKFCDVNKSKNCIYPVRDKATCFISVDFKSQERSIEALIPLQTIEVKFINSENHTGKFESCISQFKDNFIKEIKSRKIVNENEKNFFLENLGEFHNNLNLFKEYNYVIKEFSARILLKKKINDIILNNFEYSFLQIDLENLKIIKKTEKKSLINNFKFSFLILILGIYFFLLTSKKNLIFFIK